MNAKKKILLAVVLSPFVIAVVFICWFIGSLFDATGNSVRMTVQVCTLDIGGTRTCEKTFPDDFSFLKGGETIRVGDDGEVSFRAGRLRSDEFRVNGPLDIVGVIMDGAGPADELQPERRVEFEPVNIHQTGTLYWRAQLHSDEDRDEWSMTILRTEQASLASTSIRFTMHECRNMLPGDGCDLVPDPYPTFKQLQTDESQRVAVVKENGSAFDLTNLTPGTYTFTVEGRNSSNQFDLVVVPAGISPDMLSNMVHKGPVDEYTNRDQFQIEIPDAPGVLEYEMYMVYPEEPASSSPESGS